MCSPTCLKLLQSSSSSHRLCGSQARQGWFWINTIFHKGTLQKLLSGFCPLRGAGYPPIPLRKKTAENGFFGQKTLILALFDPFFGDFPLGGEGAFRDFLCVRLKPQNSGYHKLCKGLHQKVWTQTKFFSPIIHHFVVISSFSQFTHFLKTLGQKGFFWVKTVFFGQEVHYYRKTGKSHYNYKNHHSSLLLAVALSHFLCT